MDGGNEVYVGGDGKIYVRFGDQAGIGPFPSKFVADTFLAWLEERGRNQEREIEARVLNEMASRADEYAQIRDQKEFFEKLSELLRQLELAEQHADPRG